MVTPHRSVGIFVFLAFCVFSPFAMAADEGREPGTPPRLSLAEGQVSYWRPGAEDWVSARVNTALAPGDALYTGERANLELQIGGRAYVRADEKTQIELTNQEPDYLQFKVTAGRASFDLRNLQPGHTVEVDTPNAAFTIEQTGYYTAEVDGDTVHFITRRGGRAKVTPANGETRVIAPTEEVIVKGKDQPTLEVYAAPELDEWDRWNYARSDQLIDSLSSRYVPAGVYGVDDLDHYGSWRVVPTYGAVWVPDGLAPGWAPYSAGAWVLDPYYGWTWVDAAPWGWAPFHYGRWIFIDGYWAWAPGPVVVRPVYAPALVAFFGPRPHVSVSVSIGWVALGWGEPLFPWWGPVGFIGVAWWGSWGGPHIVNNVAISHTTVINVTNITYQNTHITNSVVAVPAHQFGHGMVRPTHVENFANLSSAVAPVHGALPVKPAPVHLTAGAPHAPRPPAAVTSRPVVATRPPHEVQLPWQSAQRPTKPAPRIVTPEKLPEAALPRPPFGSNGRERPRPPTPPRFEERGTAPGAGRTQERAPRARAEQAPPAHPAQQERQPRGEAPAARGQGTPPAQAGRAPRAQERAPGEGVEQSPPLRSTPGANGRQQRQQTPPSEGRASPPVNGPQEGAAAPRAGQPPPVRSTPRATAPQERQRSEAAPSSRGQSTPPAQAGGVPRVQERAPAPRAEQPPTVRSAPRSNGSQQRQQPAPSARREISPPAQASPRGQPAQQPHALPGKPANRTYPGRAQGGGAEGQGRRAP